MVHHLPVTKGSGRPLPVSCSDSLQALYTGRDTRRLYCVYRRPGGVANIHARPQDCAKAQLKHSVRVLSFLARSQDVSGAGSHEMISKAATCVAICLLLCVSDCGSQELGKSCCIDVKRQRKTSIVYSYVCISATLRK